MLWRSPPVYAAVSPDTATSLDLINLQASGLAFASAATASNFSITSSSWWYTVYTHLKIHTLSQSSLEPEIKCIAVAWFSPPPSFCLKVAHASENLPWAVWHTIYSTKKDITRSQISKIKIIKVIQNLWQCQHPKITAITPDRKLNALTDIIGFYSFRTRHPTLHSCKWALKPSSTTWWRRACVTNGGPRSPWWIGRFGNMWCLVESWLSHLPLLDLMYNEQLTFCCLFCSFQAFIWQEHWMHHRNRCLLAAFAMSHSLHWC